MTEKNVPLKVRDVHEVKERRELFKQVAIATISSRPSLTVTADADGPKVSDHFIETVSLITEGILTEATKFGEK